jgi:hypothetical protein
MPAIGNVVINDGAATPVAHTFAPVGVVGSLATLADRSGGIPVGYGKISVNIREPQNGPNGVFKVSIKVMIPTLDTTSPSTTTGIQPAPTVGYTTACMMDFLLPARSTLQNRKDVLAFVKNLLANSTIGSVVENLESIY